MKQMMYVPSPLRGRGIARTLLKGLEAWAKELCCARCVLETGIRQPEAIALYEKKGNKRIPNYGQYQGIANSVCFEKRLPKLDGQFLLPSLKTVHVYPSMYWFPTY